MAGALSARPRRRMTAHHRRMFLCSDCHAELEREGEQPNLKPEALKKLTHEKEGPASGAVFHSNGTAPIRGHKNNLATGEMDAT